MEWSFENQRADGYFGLYPIEEDPLKIKGTQQKNSVDWCPAILKRKAMQQYYSATGDIRVIKLIAKYFKYQLKTLWKFPLNGGITGKFYNFEYPITTELIVNIISVTIKIDACHGKTAGRISGSRTLKETNTK